MGSILLLAYLYQFTLWNRRRFVLLFHIFMLHVVLSHDSRDFLKVSKDLLSRIFRFLPIWTEAAVGIVQVQRGLRFSNVLILCYRACFPEDLWAMYVSDLHLTLLKVLLVHSSRRTSVVDGVTLNLNLSLRGIHWDEALSSWEGPMSRPYYVVGLNRSGHCGLRDANVNMLS